MTKQERFLENHDSELPNELIKLGQCITQLPLEQQKQLEGAFCEVVDVVKRRKRILNLVQEALSQLRLDIKYMMFDLEATRTERDEFRKKLEDAS